MANDNNDLDKLGAMHELPPFDDSKLGGSSCSTKNDEKSDEFMAVFGEDGGPDPLFKTLTPQVAFPQMQSISMLQPRQVMLKENNTSTKNEAPVDDISMPEPIFRIPVSKVVKSRAPKIIGLQEVPSNLSEYSNTIHISKDPKDVFPQIVELIESYSCDMDSNVCYDSFEVNGMVYVNDDAVKFTVKVWSDKGETRVEFLRKAGQSVAYSKFSGKMKAKICDKFANVVSGMNIVSEKDFDNSIFGGGSLDYDLTGLDIPDELKAPELSGEDLQCFEEDIESGFDAPENMNFLTDAAKKDENVALMITRDSKLMNTVMKQVLTVDVDSARSALLLLTELAKGNLRAKELLKYQMIDMVTRSLNESRDFIKKYTVKLLGSLCSHEWKLNDQDKKKIGQRIKESYQEFKNSKFATQDLIEGNVFKQIEKQLLV